MKRMTHLTIGGDSPMKNNPRFGRFFILGVLILACAGPLGAAAPQGVSPGSTDRMVQIDNSCPTFSWGAEPGRSYFELVAYRLDE